MKILSLRFGVAAVLSFCFVASSFAAVPCIWYAGENALYQVNTETKQIAQTVAIEDVQYLEMNGSDCSISVLTKKHWYRFDDNATETLAIDLQTLSRKVGKPEQLLVDPYDKSVWIRDHKTLLHFSANGDLLGAISTPGPMRAITLALDQSIWVLGNKQIWHYSAQGALLSNLDLKEKGGPQPKLFLIDNLGGVLWLAGEKQLAQIILNDAKQQGVKINLPSNAESMSLNPKTGEVWIVTRDRLLSYGRDGEELISVDLKALGIQSASQIRFDPVSQSIWLTSAQLVSGFSSQGQITTRLIAKDGAMQIAVPAFILTPTLALTHPSPQGLIKNAQPTITYVLDALCNNQPCAFGSAYLGTFKITAQLNQSAISPFVFDSARGQTTFKPTTRLPEGSNTLTAQAKDGFGRATNVSTDVFTIDTVAPKFLRIAPADGSVLTTPQSELRGAIDDVSAMVTLNGIGQVFNTSVSGTALDFAMPVALIPGINTFSLTALDKANNSTQSVVRLTYAPGAPTAPNAGKMALSALTNGLVTLTGTQGAVAPGSKVVVTSVRTQQSVNLLADGTGAFSGAVAVQAGDVLSVKVVDQWGSASASVQLNVANAPPPSGGGMTPTDPAVLASPIDPTVATQMAQSTAFLHSGPNAIQTGVAPGTIDAKHATVLRGTVSTRDEQPLSGVTVTILNHPEFGQTATRSNGMFDMAANGGGYLTLNYSKPGYLPVQRIVQAPWQDFVMAPDIVMIALDQQASTIDLAASMPMQFARSSIVTDQNGTRQATLLIPAGTTATMTLANGTTQALASITVRSTEYTVGLNGPKAMPGPLPPTSGYTYAVENSIDEAIAAGAEKVQFNQPIYQYVDNFLNFPVGGIVPAGYYDRKKAAWLASNNGKVIKVLSVAGGIATIDSRGGGQADDAAQLATLKITDAERTQLATLYVAGTTLWRVPLMHFTPWDYNWPYGPPDDAAPPDVPDPETPDVEDPCIERGCIIEVENQTFGEEVPVTGTPFSLNYKSNRMPGFNAFSIPITLSGAKMPSSAYRIDLEVTVAGRQYTQSFPAGADQSYTFLWDGLDAFGRRVQGVKNAYIRIGYVYPGVYRNPAEFELSFANFGSGSISGGRKEQEITLWKDAKVAIGNWQATAVGLGGWTLNAQHAYDPYEEELSLGDGRSRSVRSLREITAVAGTGMPGFSGDGLPATGAQFNSPSSLVLDAQGNIFVADQYNRRVRKITPTGRISTVAGNGSRGSSGDGGLATEAAIDLPNGLAVDSQGNLYISSENRVRKVTQDGIIKTVAGNGNRGFAGDGGQATEAKLWTPYGLAVDAQGNLFISDYSNRRIRKVTTDGVINTVAGNGSYGYSGDGRLATNAAIDESLGLAVDTQGNLYIGQYFSRVVRKVSPNGIISTVAGNGGYGSSGDGGPATLATMTGASGLTVDAQGSLFISDGNRVRKVSPNGIISTVAGSGIQGFSGDQGRPAAATLSYPSGVAVDARGSLFIADTGNHRVRKVASNFPAMGTGGYTIASNDGAQLYHFDAVGRHLRTLSSTTGAAQFSFSYDTQGYISTITDGDNNVTRIERDTAGQPSAILAQDGQRTVLTVDASNYLETISNPANETHRMTYGKGGLLTKFTNPRKQSSFIEYNENGRLRKDNNAAGGFWELVRSGIDTDYTVELASALGRIKRRHVQKFAAGDVRRTNTEADGTVSVIVTKADGSTQTTSADGTLVTVIDTPDPRFGMQAPIKSSTLTLPSGLTSKTTAHRQSTLGNPADLLSLVTQADTVTVNGKEFKSVYNVSLRQFTSISPLNRQSIVTTDAQSRPLTAQTSGNLPINFRYDSRGRLQSVNQGAGIDTRGVSYTYNAEGYVDAAIDVLLRQTRYTYDAVGRVKSVTLPDSRVIGYTYDANGNIQSVTAPTRPPHGFLYNPIDLTTEYSLPALGAQPVTTQYRYNLDKQLIKEIRPGGRVLDYGYDSFGRLTNVTALSGVIGYSYQPSTGQLASVTAPSGVNLTYTYDGALPISTNVTGAIAGNIAVGYDNFMRVNRIGLNGNDIAFNYDDDGLLSAAGSLALERDAANGNLIGSILGQTVTNLRYNAFGELTAFTAKQGENVLYDEVHTRDNVGQIDSRAVTVRGQTNFYRYTYDPNGRLTGVTKDGSPAGNFMYDANGNRTLAYGISATYDARDRIINYGGAQYTYSPFGDLLQILAGTNITGYAYDDFGNLVHADLPNGKKIDYLADGLQRRVGKKVNGTLTQAFVYQDQLKPAAELDGNGNVISTFVYAGKANVPDYIVKGGISYRIVTDHLGSVRLVVDSATGQIVQQLDYDEWGNVQGDSNPGFQPFGFAGGIYDHDTKLTRFGARDYDAVTARWIQSDPIGLAGGINTYAYVGGNPLSYVDPNGLDPVGAAIGGTIGSWGGRVVGGIGGTAVLPGPGTVAGGVVGGYAGGALGRAIGGAAGDYLLASKHDADNGGGKCKMKNAPRGDGENMPGDPQRQNKQANEAAKRAGLNPDESEKFHHAISGQNNGWQQLLDIAKSIKSGTW